MHYLVRDLYKRALHVGKNYPTGMDHVREVWKKAIRNPENCPSCYSSTNCHHVQLDHPNCKEEILQAVNRGRVMVKEMIGVIQLKKYRTMKQRYGDTEESVEEAMQRLEQGHHAPSKHEL